MNDLGDRAVELTSELIAIDSVSPSLAPGAPGEERIADVVAGRLAMAGFAVQRIPSSDPRRPNVVAIRDGSRPGRSVVLNGHLDTVPVDRMAEPFVPRVDGDRLYGRGASDMKGGVAGLVVAAEELAALDAPGRQIVALVSDEEDASIGATAVLAELERIAGRPDVCLIAEPTWLDIAEAHRGYEVVRVELTGRASHSSQPHEGLDVIPVVAHTLSAIAERDRELQRITPDPQLDRGSLMATVVRAGSAPFTIAASAEILVERRTLPSESADAGYEEVNAILASLELPAGMSASARSLIRRSAWQLATDGAAQELSVHLAESLVDAGASKPRRRGFPYWMEAALWDEAGVPTVVCGPAGGGLHAIDEWVDLNQLRAFPVAVVEAVLRFAAS
ncbi:M20/M25/M40 family metallo-hydrolase [Diaminobutyricimonas sp. TR449]|uniref:M20/M25/M40 family metallo-hydrolase n=1 Tax=Diaminobutyricimonas sp. TR449 TaxID=2708076 RepID=UPI001420C816|nr:M20/M25/M40 family metallo-hydrolase [Diaminobutyricimonas sp. TR449]